MNDVDRADGPLEEPFWKTNTLNEWKTVTSLLRARFPCAFDILDAALEETDPMEVVYPGNPGEYTDVVCEILVLLAPENADLASIPRARIAEVLRRGLARRFGEEPEERRLAQAVDRIHQRKKEGSDSPGWARGV